MRASPRPKAAPTPEAGRVLSPRLATSEDAPFESPARAQAGRLEAALSRIDDPKGRYPGSTRALIFLVGSMGSWALLLSAARLALGVVTRR